MTDHLLPRYRRLEPAELHIADERPHHTAAGGDKRTLRGIPVVGATTGASPGTNPLQALLATEHHTRRHRRT